MDLCIYCLTNAATTRDHIPPKGLFKKPRPSNLIVVPACDSCNGGFQKDDEYFLTLAMDWQASDTPDGAAVTDSRIRSMSREDGRGKGLWWPIYDKMRVVEAISEGGIYLGQTFQVTLDVPRLTRTINRIIRGLFYDATKRALPVAATVASLPFETYCKKHKDDPNALECLEHLPTLPSRAIGDGVFRCCYCLTDDNDLFASFWYLEFYSRWAFIGMTRGLGELPTKPVHSSDQETIA